MLRMMKQGQTGPDILAIQKALNIRLLGNSPRIREDGVFGPKTEGAVKEFQRLKQLQVDGIVGPITRSVLYPLVATTVNIFGTRTGEPGGSAIQQPVAAALSPSKLQLRGHALPTNQGVAASKIAIGMPAFPQPSPRFQLESLRLPGLASPIQVPAQPTSSSAFHLDSFQGSTGFQRSFTSLFKDPQDAFGLSLQTVFLRNKDDGHLEFAPGLQIGAPLFGASSDSAAWTFSWFANFTWVDPLGALGLFHFWAPFAAVGGQVGLSGPLNPALGASVFPINLSVDLIPDRLNLSASGGAAGNMNLLDGTFTWGPQVSFGVNGTFFSF